jgi:hypothetical protein
MVLWVHSNRAYLVEPNTKSRVSSYFFLSNFISDLSKATPHLNRPIHTFSKILKNIVSSAVEYEIASAFENGQDTIVIHHTLIKMGHPQPPTPI